MSVQVRRRREAASFLQSFVGAQGELLVDTTNNRVQVHDGTTPGGWPAARLADVAQRRAVADAGATVLASDRTIAFTALSAARTVTLPAASSFPTGTTLTILDESGACSATLSITVARVGTDTINGLAAMALVTPYGFLALQSNGTARWTVIDQSLVPNRKTFTDVAFAGSQSIPATSFTRVTMSSVNADTGGNWSSANNWYVCPRSGVYLITGSIRVKDQTSPGTTYSCGVYTSEGDGPFHLWTSVGPTPAYRATFAYSRLSYQNVGDSLRMFTFSDASGGVTIIAAGLQICLVSDAL